MYKLLIADDEPLVSVALESMLPWEQYHISVCGTAINGRQALEMIRSLRPDLVITDIKMPIMTGLELLQACRSSMEQPPEFIILTCYEDFPFIKTALKYQAVDYIIKLGIKPEELEHSVKRALKNIRARNPGHGKHRAEGTSDQHWRDKFLLKLLNNLFDSEEQFHLQAKDLGLSFNGFGYASAACVINCPNLSANDGQSRSLCRKTLSMLSNLLVKYVPFWLVSLDQRHFHILFELEKQSPYLDLNTFSSLLHEVLEMVENYFNVTVFCGVGDYKYDIHEVPASYQESRQVLPLCAKERPVVFYQEYQPRKQEETALWDTFQIAVLKDDIRRAFEEYDMKAFQHIVDSIRALFDAHPDSYSQAMDVTSSILHLCLAMVPGSEPSLAACFDQYRDSYLSLYRQKNTRQIMEWLEVFSQAVTTFCGGQHKELKNTLVSNITEYIEKHLSEKLVLNDVASVFSISPNYLGHLFKKAMSTGFNEYVTQAKISRAKYLMFHTDLKIYEIAEQVGFENSFYFSRVFKKTEGLSPRQYIREQFPGQPEG